MAPLTAKEPIPEDVYEELAGPNNDPRLRFLVPFSSNRQLDRALLANCTENFPRTSMTTPTKPAAQNPMALVYLHGQGDLDIKLVPLCVLTWLHMPYEPAFKKDSSYNEELPAKVAQVFDALEPSSAPHRYVRVTVGSYCNDRALAIPGPSFSSLLELIEHIQTNNPTIVDEFEGQIY